MISGIAIVVKISLLLWLVTEVFARLVRPSEAEWYRSKVRAMLIGLYALGIFSPSIWIVYAALVAVIPMMARTRGEGAALYVVAIASMPELSYGVRAGGAAVLQVDKFLCCSIGLLIVFFSKRPVGLKTSGRNHLPFVCQTALQYIQARGINATSLIRELVGTSLAFPAPYFAFTGSVRTMTQLRRVMLAFAFTGFFLAAVAMLEASSHFFVYREVLSRQGLPGMDGRLFKMRGGLLRSLTIFGDVISFALFLAVSLMATIASRDMFRRPHHSIFVMAAILIGIQVTGSRNGLVAVAIAIVAYDLFRGRFAAMAGKVSLLVIAFLTASLLAEFSPYMAAMTGKSEEASSSTDYRSQLFDRGMEEFRKRPFAGASVNDVYASLSDLKQGEGIVDFVNAYLYYGLIGGVGGVILFAASFILPCVLLLTARSRLRKQGQSVMRFAAFVFSSSIAMGVSVAFTSYGGHGVAFFYVVLAIGAILYGWSKLPPAVIAASDGLMAPVPISASVAPAVPAAIADQRLGETLRA